MSAATAQMGNVRMSAQMQRHIRHASDVMRDRDECFGGDALGHWNVARINRILDAMNAPTIWMPIPRATRYDMARVGAPDERRAPLYVSLGIKTMPPLTFVQMPGGAADEVRSMLVDGHHRMLALFSMDCDVPARILPASLADDVRIIEMGEVAIFPTPTWGALREAELGRTERGIV